MNPRRSRYHLSFLLVLLSAGVTPLAAQETILQYFNTSWAEIRSRIPEVAEAGYTALWLPPPQKGASGGFSVGYDVYDRFDLGDRDQSGSLPTRYGTRAELLALVDTAHRFGLRVYFDNVMAHTGGPLDAGTPAGTLFPSLRGFVPEDFHLVRRSGQWQKASDSIDYNDEWQVLNRNPFSWDIAQELPVNVSFNPSGSAEGQSYARWSGIRQPGETQYYLDTDLPVGSNGEGAPVYTFANREPWTDSGYGAGGTGAGNGRFDWNDSNGNGQHDAGEISEPFGDTGIDPSRPERRVAAWGFNDGRYNMGNPVAEDVNSFLNRSARYVVDMTRCDGFRLDAVKHVPPYFFGKQDGADKDRVNWGYSGQIQEQYNITHGYTDWSNHRDTNFNAALGRDDALLFGEHLGAPPDPGGYTAAGIRLANDDFINAVSGPGGIGGSLQGYDTPGAFTRGVDQGVTYALSHDNNSMSGADRPAAHQYMLMRAGLPVVYTDGYNVAGGPDYFPKPSYVPFLGQYGQTWVTGSLRVRQDFIRGGQYGRWSTQDFAAWEFRDKSENAGMNDDAATTLLVMMVRGFTSGQTAPGGFTTTFAAGTLLRNVSPYNGEFFAFAGNDGRVYNEQGQNVTVPSGGYFAFAPPVPGQTAAFAGSDSVRPLRILENGQPVAMTRQPRRDGRDGDPAYAYDALIPLVRDGSALTFLASADGSAENILLKLDGGVDVNSGLNLGPQTGTRVDNGPGSGAGNPAAMDLFAGYEQMQFVSRVTEKFAAADVVRNGIGSPGAETWQAVIGSAGITRNDGGGTPDTDTATADWVYHDPAGAHQIGSTLQFSPLPAVAGGTPVQIVAKIGYAASGITKAWIYYTTDGSTYPEGSGGTGAGSTRVASLTKVADGTADGGSTPEWWRGTLPAMPSGTVLRYKIGAHREDAASRYPVSVDQVSKAARMETLFAVSGFAADTVVYPPHNDQGVRATGLVEGMHVLRSRAFLSRGGKASLFRTNVQSFYLDQVRPQGLVRYPSADGETLGGASYGMVILTDDTVNSVRVQIRDTAPENNSAAAGNGAGVWADATAVTVPGNTAGTAWRKEWRFAYADLPSSGQAEIRVRLRELTSLADDALTDEAGWFTTLTRTVNTGAAVNFAIAYPVADGDTVSAGYVVKAAFDLSLGDGRSDADLLGEFRVYADALEIPASALAIFRNEQPGRDALAVTLPDLDNGQPDFLHALRIVHTRGDVSMEAMRLVKAVPPADGDGDGLPDYWEALWNLNAASDTGADGASGDPDKDGAGNLTEYLFGTSPRAGGRAGTPAITWLDSGDRTLTFPASASRRYQVEVSAHLSGWTPVGPEILPMADDAQYLWIDAEPAVARRFYRVRARLR